MTQTIVINAENFKSDRERVHWIAELGDIMDDFSRPHASLLRNCNRNQFDDEQLEYFHRIQGETRVRRWVVLYKKSGRTIKFDSRRYDSIIHTRLLGGLDDDSITGDIVLYKTGQVQQVWPYRTADEHYSGSHHFITGNVNIPEIYSSNNDLRLDETHNLLYKAYCEESFPDYRSTSLTVSMSYKLYVLMHMSNSEWVDTFNGAFDEAHRKIMRAGHLIWTDGRVQRDWIIGGMLHPRFYGDPRF